MTIKDIANLNPSDYFYNLKDKLINYVAKKSYNQFDISDNLRNDIKTKEEFLEYQKQRRDVLEKFTANVPYDKSLPLNPQITGVIETEDLIIEKIIITSRKNVYVPCTLYLPKKREGKVPVILMQMGHAEKGKLHPMYQKIARLHAKNGFAVLSIDPVGQGERLSYIDEKTGEILVPATCPEHQQFGNQCFLTGNYPIRYFICDAMRAIDYIETREELDSEKIGATGTSGGGTMTSLIMAYDKRIKAATPSCFLTTRREYYPSGGVQDAEQIWVGGTKENFDHYELISCFCPRPLLILAAKSDFFPLEGTEKIYNKGKEFYKLFGCEENIRMFTDDCEHKYTLNAAAKSVEFYTEIFLNKKVTIEAKDLGSLDNGELYSTKSGQVIKDFSDALIIYEENLKDYNNAKVKTIEEKREFLNSKVFNGREDTKFYLKKFETPDADNLLVERYMWYSQPDMPCYGVKFTDKDNHNENSPYKIYLFENGTDDIEKFEKEIKDTCQKGMVSFVVDLSSMGKCETNRLHLERTPKEDLGTEEKLSRDLFFLGDSLCALRSYDLIRTINLLNEEFKVSQISLFCDGKASVYGRILEILDDSIKTEFHNEVTVEDIITNKYYDKNNIAGMVMPELGLYLK